jgi:hypothetical protein
MSQEPFTPVIEILVTKKLTLRELLKLNEVLNDVETGRRIILVDGRHLSDLDEVILPGKRIVIVSIEALGGG